MKEEDRRPDSEQLLRSIQNADGPPGGRLKIFFGYAAGVGKTYAMLEAAHRAKEAGVDVVAGYIEPHTRPETMVLLEGLEVLPTKTVTYKGISLKEFDLDGALARHPQLLLVDELAHTNAQGSRHRKHPGAAAGGDQCVHHGERPASGEPQRRGGLHHGHFRVRAGARQCV